MERAQQIHERPKIKRFRVMLRMKQEPLDSDLGEDWTQKKIAQLKAKEKNRAGYIGTGGQDFESKSSGYSTFQLRSGSQYYFKVPYMPILVPYFITSIVSISSSKPKKNLKKLYATE